MNRLRTALLLTLSGTLLACSGVTDQSVEIAGGELTAAGDPRVTGDGLTFDRPPFTDRSDTAHRYMEMMPEPGVGEK